MKKIELAQLDQSLYYEKLENGLEVYLVPYTNKKNHCVYYATRYGSVQSEFVPVGKKEMQKVPDGIAHFLEHKMFEQESGIDPFSFYAESGTDCNAATSFESTKYLFSGTSKLEENLDYLLSYVNRPYFTDENVAKEKGIISEEIKMYDDDPEWCMEILMKECTFHNDPVRLDIAGTVDSISSITKEDLYLCYNTFYQPSNMFVLAVGNLDPEKVLDVIKKNELLKEKKVTPPVEVKAVEEPNTVAKEKTEVEFEIMNTKVGLTVKVPWDKEMDHYTYDMYCGMILNMLFGSSSLYSEEIRKQGYATSFYYLREYTKDYLTFSFVAQTDVPEKFVDFVVDKIKKAPLEEADFERIKKVWISSEVIMVDSVETTIDNLFYDLIEFGEVIPDKIDRIKSLDFDTLKEVRKGLDVKNHSVVIARPKEKE